jgi:hypothetical protein
MAVRHVQACAHPPPHPEPIRPPRRGPCEHGSLTVRFDPATPWHGAPSGRRGGQAVQSAAAIQACPTIEVPFGLPPRRNAKPWRTDCPGAGARDEALRAIERLGRAMQDRARDASGDGGAAIAAAAAPRRGRPA